MRLGARLLVPLLAVVVTAAGASPSPAALALSAAEGPGEGMLLDSERSGLPGDAAATLPPGAMVLDAQRLPLPGERPAETWGILYSLPNPASIPAGAPPIGASLTILTRVPAGWRMVKTVAEGDALGARMQIVQVDGQPALAVSFGLGANSAGLFVVRSGTAIDYPVVYDGSGDSVILRDLDGDGTPEVLRSLSPFCQSHVASPRITTVYAWGEGTYGESTSRFPQTLDADQASFQAALNRAADPKTTPAWQPADKACLHAALGFLATEAGNAGEAQAQYAEAKRLDPSYDVEAINRLVAGKPMFSGPRPAPIQAPR